MRSAILVLLIAISGAAQTSIDIDVTAPAKPFPHVWERAFGSGRANLSLRQSYRDDLKAVRTATGFEYIRFHAIFHDENGVYSEDEKGNPIYNWTYVDQIYDGLVNSRVRPFVELSFMPSKMASSQTPHAFWYKPLPSPPKDYERWGALIEAFTRHVVERYGIDEVSRWPFEVWNEPNIDFWTGDPKEETYQKLYVAAVKAVKKVSPKIQVGGPSTAQAAWVGRFIAYCAKNKVPLDFASTHVYGNDKAEDVFGTSEVIPRKEMVIRAVRKVRDEIKQSAMPNLPLYFSEYNASYMNEVDVTDSAYMGPWLAYTISKTDGLVDIMSYWCFSDVFEEQGIAKTPFYGGFGLIAAGDIPKAAFNDFKLLHKLGVTRIPNANDSVLVTKRRGTTLAIALWNYAPPEEAGTPQKYTLNFKGLTGTRELTITVVDENHGSALAAWMAMGKPAFPTLEQQKTLRDAAQMPEPERRELTAGSPLELVLQPKGLALIEISSPRK